MPDSTAEADPAPPLGRGRGRFGQSIESVAGLGLVPLGLAGEDLRLTRLGPWLPAASQHRLGPWLPALDTVF